MAASHVPSRILPAKLLEQLLRWFPASVSWKDLHIELAKAGYLSTEAAALMTVAIDHGFACPFDDADGRRRYCFDGARLAAAQQALAPALSGTASDAVSPGA